MIKDRLYKKNTILTIPCIHMYWREPSNQFTMFLSARQNIHSVLPARIIKEHWHGIRRQRRWWSASRNRIRTSWTSTFITYEAAKGEKWGTFLFELYSRTCIYLRTQCVYIITLLGFIMYFSVWAVFSENTFNSDVAKNIRNARCKELSPCFEEDPTDCCKLVTLLLLADPAAGLIRCLPVPLLTGELIWALKR